MKKFKNTKSAQLWCPIVHSFHSWRKNWWWEEHTSACDACCCFYRLGQLPCQCWIFARMHSCVCLTVCARGKFKLLHISQDTYTYTRTYVAYFCFTFHFEIMHVHFTLYFVQVYFPTYTSQYFKTKPILVIWILCFTFICHYIKTMSIVWYLLYHKLYHFSFGQDYHNFLQLLYILRLHKN